MAILRQYLQTLREKQGDADLPMAWAPPALVPGRPATPGTTAIPSMASAPSMSRYLDPRVIGSAVVAVVAGAIEPPLKSRDSATPWVPGDAF